ncbi:MAG: RIP metalloprotease RseP [Anaerolineae bacterium]|nr:RIP metalloprotease RseP [Anaerolineae bacterium]
MNEFLLSLASFAIMLVPTILLHELGHFVAGKLVGITILEFGLGFPPRLVKLFEHRGTEYTLNMLPLGGFVRPLGEDFVRPVGEEEASGDWAEARRRGITNPKSVNQAGPWQRIFFMAAGAGTNFLTAVVVFIIMALIGLPVVRGATVAIQSVETGSTAANAGLETGDVIVRVDDDYIDSSAALTQYLQMREGREVTLTVERGEETFETAMLVDGMTGAAPVENVLVLGVVTDSPAGEAGLMPGDIILAGDGERFTSLAALQDFTNARKGQEVALLVERDGEQFTLSLTPRTDPPANEGPIGISISTLQTSAALGVTLADYDAIIDYQPAPLGEAVQYGINRTTETLSLIVQAPIEIIRGNIAPEQARPVSIVGISQIGGQRLEESVEFQSALPILDFAAVISLALGLTNLLPIPGLDGGRIVFVVIELLRGKPISPEREGMVHMIGLLLLLGTMSIFIINDIVNPITLNLP